QPTPDPAHRRAAARRRPDEPQTPRAPGRGPGRSQCARQQRDDYGDPTKPRTIQRCEPAPAPAPHPARHEQPSPATCHACTPTPPTAQTPARSYSAPESRPAQTDHPHPEDATRRTATARQAYAPPALPTPKQTSPAEAGAEAQSPNHETPAQCRNTAIA